MTQKQKDLLLKDLCARLPYGVKIYLDDFPNATLIGVVNGGIILHCDKNDYTYNTHWNIEYTKPYLRLMSSMTEEQYKEYWELEHSGNMEHLSIPALDWLNKNHFDYRGLIEKGLAIEAPEGMYN